MSQASHTGRDAVLAIDDEAGFLFILKAALESEGFVVHTASNANEAIACYKERLQEIGLVLLDFFMPDMTGECVFECLQQLNPDVRVVLLTGHDREVAEPMFERGLRDYVQKPFCVRDLGERVRKAIAA
jgi:DNA-binding NtrC family response regulator